MWPFKRKLKISPDTESKYKTYIDFANKHTLVSHMIAESSNFTTVDEYRYYLRKTLAYLDINQYECFKRYQESLDRDFKVK